MDAEAGRRARLGVPPCVFTTRGGVLAAYHAPLPAARGLGHATPTRAVPGDRCCGGSSRTCRSARWPRRSVAFMLERSRSPCADGLAPNTGGPAVSRAAATAPASFGPLIGTEPAVQDNGAVTEPAPRTHLADRHGRRPRARGGADPRGEGVHRRPARARDPVPRAHQQLDLHPARPARAAAPQQRHRRAGGVDLDVGARDGAVPRRPAAGRVGVRRRRGGAHRGGARHRLRDDRPGPRLRRARRDADVLVRGDHPGDPADQRRRPLHRDQPRRRAARAPRGCCRRPARWRR